MSTLKNIGENFKHFRPTSWSVTHKTAIYLIIVFLSLVGIYTFVSTPKEQYPDVVIPQIYVQTIYVGNSPKDMENLVTRPLEKQIKGITGAKITKFTSTSQQDYSAIIIEFDTDVKIEVALQKVKDAIDKAKQDLPTDLTQEPTALEVSVSDFPSMYVNISGNYDQQHLKKFADDMQDRLEDLAEINRVDEVGAPEREFQINVDNYRMQSAGITFNDIANAVAYENTDISGGQLDVGDMKRNLQLKGQFHTAEDISTVVVRNGKGDPIYLKDIATIKDTTKERDSYARLNGKNVITLNIIKRSGENLIQTSEDVHKAVEEMQAQWPKDLDVKITGDLSTKTKTSFNDLVNSIVIGFILVLIILMFFMGVVNAFFVALSVPLSMFVAFVFLPTAELITGSTATLNFIVLFALLFGLGIIVDDAIVVIENTHRIFTQSRGKLSPTISAQMAAGEIFVPVLAGTLTTLAPFFPLLFWPGIIGKFMIYLPTMLIFTLTASLIVAFIMNPVFAVDFMSHEEGEHKEKPGAIFRKRGFWIAVAVAVLFDLVGFAAPKNPEPEATNMWFFWGNLILLIVLLFILNRYVLDRVIHSFQNRALPWIMGHYEKGLRWAIKGWRPAWLFIGTVALFFVALFLFMGSVSSGRNQVVFFPAADPNQVYVYMKLPVGTSVEYTDSLTRQLERKVYGVLGMQNGKQNPVVESVITNVAKGAADPMSGDQSTRSELSRIQVSFVDFEKRNGVDTKLYLDSIRKVIKGIPGAEITVSQEQNGPPTDPPVNIEIMSENFDDLTRTAIALKNYLDSIQVPGIEELKMNVDLNNPEITLTVDRQRALIEGVSSAQIGQEIRTALFGREVSKIKEGKDEYKIQLRNNELQRHNLVELLNMPIYFRDMATGGFKSIPISNLVKVDLTSTLGSVKRKNQKREIALVSNVLNGYTAPGVNKVITQKLADFKEKPDDVTIQQTGEGEQQAETVSFLGKAFLIAFGLILFVLVLQFNSISKSVIILSEIIFSIIGVFIGYVLTGMTVSGIMTCLGVVGLAGIVIKNGILVIEFTEELRARGLRTREAVIQAGKTRIIPVLLTALAVILGLIPLAIGFNINFITMFSELNPHIFLGGDNAAFWKPLSWTIIFGVMFAFFMTLFIVPSMYLIAERLKRPMRRMYGGKWISFMGIPPLTIIFLLLLVPATLIKHSIQVSRRKMRLSPKTTNEAFYGSWF